MASTSELIALARDLGEALDGDPDENVPDALLRLAVILATEADAQVVTAALDALGRAWDPRASQLIVDHVRIDHPNSDVRLAVAEALPGGVNDNDSPLRDAVIIALIALTGDEESKVRDYACFGLGQLDAASPGAKDALAARLNDSDDETRCEALFALAKTGDPRAGASLQVRLAPSEAEDVFLLEIRAAAELADPRLHSLLVRLGQDWASDDDDFTPALAFATTRCRPEAIAQAAVLERELRTRINTMLADQGAAVALVGVYPHTALTFQGVDGASSPAVLDAIWSEEDPWVYPIEQHARSFIQTYASDIRDDFTRDVDLSLVRPSQRLVRRRTEHPELGSSWREASTGLPP